MKLINYKDKKKRKIYKKNELERMRLRSIINNIELNLPFKNVNYLKLTKMKRNSVGNPYKNRCLLTSTSKSVYRKFKLSRWELRKLCNNGEIMGLHKASW